MVAELTADEVEEACASCLVLRCAEQSRALAVLAERCPAARLTALPGDAVRIEGDVAAEEVGRALMEEGVVVRDLHRTEGDREGFFVELMGGRDVEDAPAPPMGGGRRTGGE